jgi:hypothetical protein
MSTRVYLPVPLERLEANSYPHILARSGKLGSALMSHFPFHEGVETLHATLLGDDSVEVGIGQLGLSRRLVRVLKWCLALLERVLKVGSLKLTRQEGCRRHTVEGALEKSTESGGVCDQMLGQGILECNRRCRLW